MVNSNGNGIWKNIQRGIVTTVISAVLAYIPGSIWWASKLTQEVNDLSKDVVEMTARVEDLKTTVATLDATIQSAPAFNKERIDKIEQRVIKIEDAHRIK